MVSQEGNWNFLPDEFRTLCVQKTHYFLQIWCCTCQLYLPVMDNWDSETFLPHNMHIKLIWITVGKTNKLVTSFDVCSIFDFVAQKVYLCGASLDYHLPCPLPHLTLSSISDLSSPLLLSSSITISIINSWYIPA